MKRVRITVVRKVCHRDLIARYENPIEHACDLSEGQVFVSEGWQKPEGLCESAWQTLSPFVMALAHGATGLYDGWMKNPASAMHSSNAGIRPESFLDEALDNCPPHDKHSKRNDMRSSILIIYTGGTIGMKTDAETGALVPFDFSGIYEEFPSLKRLNVDIEVYTMDPVIDSSNVSPANWLTLARLIRDNYARYDGFVVLHGTDTMSYTASAISFLLENLSKPVVFTGSQIPIGVLRTDGRENLITAIEIAGARIDGRPEVPEVSLYFQNRLFRANRTTKGSAEALNAFRSYNYPPLAEVGVNIAYNLPAVLQPADTSPELRIATRLADGIAIVKLFPGLGEEILRAMLSAPGLRAVVLETYGAGTAPTSEWFLRVLRAAIDRGVILLNVTQCRGGGGSMEFYETGLRLQKIGVLSGYDMTTEAAVTKLMYVLGLGLDETRTRELLRRPLRGEFTL